MDGDDKIDYERAKGEIHDAMNKLREFQRKEPLPYEELGKPPYCSFCGKSKDKVNTLIAGPSVYICNECVNICQEIIDKKKGDK